MNLRVYYPIGDIESVGFGVDMLYFFDERPTQAIINFSSMNPGKFERYSWFISRPLRNPTLYVFLKDEEQHFYLGVRSERGSRHVVADRLKRLLSDFGIDSSKAVTIGSSMGGYASIFYAHFLSFKAAISINPQANIESAKLHRYSLWERKMNEADWIDLDKFLIDHRSFVTETFLLHGQYPADSSAANAICSALELSSCLFSIQVVKNLEHGWMGMSQNQLCQILDKQFIST